MTRYRQGDYYGLHYDFSQPKRSIRHIFFRTCMSSRAPTRCPLRTEPARTRREVDPVKYPHGDVERSATLVLYLTDGFEGGETVFPRVKTPGSAGKVSVCIGGVLSAGCTLAASS